VTLEIFCSCQSSVSTATDGAKAPERGFSTLEAPMVTGMTGFRVQPWSQLCDHMSDRASDDNTGGQGLHKCMVAAGQEVLRSKGQLEAQSSTGIPHRTAFAKVGTRNSGQPCLSERDNESFKRNDMRRGQQPALNKHSWNFSSSVFRCSTSQQRCMGYQSSTKDYLVQMGSKQNLMVAS